MSLNTQLVLTRVLITVLSTKSLIMPSKVTSPKTITNLTTTQKDQDKDTTKTVLEPTWKFRHQILIMNDPKIDTIKINMSQELPRLKEDRF